MYGKEKKQKKKTKDKGVKDMSIIKVNTKNNIYTGIKLEEEQVVFPVETKYVDPKVIGPVKNKRKPRKSSRADGTNPRAKGTNPRALKSK